MRWWSGHGHLNHQNWAHKEMRSECLEGLDTAEYLHLVAVDNFLVVEILGSRGHPKTVEP